MPPLQPGDPGDGHGEDGDDEHDVGYVPPLPPEDRLWRHPSEVASGRVAAPARPPRRRIDPRAAGLAAVSGAVGAALAVATIGATGGFDDPVGERRVAVHTSVLGTGVEDLEAVVTRTGPSVAALTVHRGTTQHGASAVAVRSDGHLVTDADAIEGAEWIDVDLPGDVARSARVVGVDDVTGIAVLHVDAELPGAVLADDADHLRVGARTVALGAAAEAGWGPTVSANVVSSLHRRLDSASGDARHGLVVLDEPTAPGAVGGALVDQAGVVVGILGRGSTADGADVAVATPIDLARHVADQIIDRGRVQHVWLGLHGTDLVASDAMARGLAGGALVDEVDDGGPASQSGIRAGDVVVSCGGEPTPSMSALIATLRRHLPGDVVDLVVHRADGARTVPVTLAARG